MISSAGQSPWSQSADHVLAGLSVDPGRGLDAREVSQRRQVWGPNRLESAPRRRVVSLLLAQLKSVVVILLLGAGLLAFAFSDYAEGLAIFAVVIINSAIGFVTEWRAVRSMEALREFARVECVVQRGGVATTVAAEALVPGDIVMFDAGDLVPADIRVITSAKLTANESTLTGESLPVNKHCEPIAENTDLLARDNMLFKGTSVTRGSGSGVVTGTGTNTEFGKIFEQVAEAEPQQTPLEKRLDALGVRLAYAIVVIAVLVAVAGIVAGRELFLAIEVAIALSVAAIPEGLAIVATIALARGVWRMARRNALITRLSAVETLGATSVILTDKTGTLTENRMALSCVLLEGHDVAVDGAQDAGAADFHAGDKELANDVAAMVDELLQTGVLCSNASLDAADPSGGVGDPTELALLVAASGRDIWRKDLLQRTPEIREDPFDPDSKRMATLHRHDEGCLVAVKGAPEAIVPLCDAVRTAADERALAENDRQRWLDRARELGDRGLRTIAVARKSTSDDATGLYDHLVLIGIVGLEDPAREGVGDAIRRCLDAGIDVVMVTGDHAATARNIALATGIVEGDAPRVLNGTDVDELFAGNRHEALLQARVFSRVTPEQKLRLIALYQQRGHVVAMTGDGVNDAPALKKADIGVAMGVRGTAVAKEAAAMVLQDDEFGTIVAAVSHGRVIFDNIRKFVVYLLSCNVSEVLVVGLATIAGAPLPLLPLQILFLNLVTDVFPALALGVGKGSPALMQNRPRHATERILTRKHWRRIALHGAILAFTVLAAMVLSHYYLGYGHRDAVSVAFLTLAFAQMWHVVNMRDDLKALFNNEITRNLWIWAALAICLVLVLLAIYLPPLREVLELSDPGMVGWGLILAMSLFPVLAAPLVSGLTGGRGRRQSRLSRTS